MPITPPRLDDRSYDDLVAELVARIPSHTPEWTHHQPGDPGRTLIELFAWLADTILYRANLIPERQRLVFLRLLGVRMRPAVPARGVVSVAYERSTAPTQPVVLRRGCALEGPVVFETLAEHPVQPVFAQAMVKRRLNREELAASQAVIAQLEALYQVRGATPYTTELVGLERAARPVDVVAESIDQTLWLGLFAANADQVDDVRAALAGQILSVGVAPAETPRERVDDPFEMTPVPHVWEMSRIDPISGTHTFDRLDVLDDSSKGLTTRGVLRLRCSGNQISAPSNDVGTDLFAGVGDRPPRLDDEATAARLVAWLRLRPTESLGRLALRWVDVNAVEIAQLRTLRNVVAGTGTGLGDDVVRIAADTVLPGTLRFEVEEPQRGFVRWTLTDDLSRHTADDRVAELDPEAGTLTFGDGMRGRRVAAGMRIRIVEMQVGGGRAGNLAPGVLKAIRPVALDGASIAARLRCQQLLETDLGDDAETLDEAQRRIPATLRHRNRAVTELDFRQLALTTPGVEVARVEVLPGFKPQQRRSGVPGVVSVMVVPRATSLEAPYPRPDRRFITAVHGWLEPRRTLGTELYVIAPEYVPVAVAIAIQLVDGADREATTLAVREALRRYVFATPPGGPAGTGWPIGQAISNIELDTAAGRVAGVRAVVGARLFRVDGDRWRAVEVEQRGGAQVLRLGPEQLPELLAVHVEVSDRVPDALTGRPPTGADAGIAIPVVPEVC